MGMLRQASLFALLTLILDFVPLVMAAVYVSRPTERHLALMRPLSLAGLFAALSGGVLGFINVLRFVWTHELTAETYRVMGLQGVEMVLLGYNTPRHHPPAPEHDRLTEFHNQLSMQAGAYQNGTWVVGVAKCGVEEGCEMIGNSSIIAPTKI